VGEASREYGGEKIYGKKCSGPDTVRCVLSLDQLTTVN